MELVGSYSNKALQSQELRDLRKQQSSEIKVRVVAKEIKIRQNQNRLAVAELERLASDYRSGVPVREIAAKYRINRNTVNEHARRMGLPRRHA